MHGRTFFRIMFDYVFVNNVFCRAINAFIDFCNEQNNISPKKLKFSTKMPLKNIETKMYMQKNKIQYGVLGSIYVNKCNK